MDYQEILSRLKRSIAVRYPDTRNLAGEFSELLGVAKRTVHHKLSGRTQFSVKELLVILHHLKIPPSEIMDKFPRYDTHSLELLVHDLSDSKEFRRMIDWYYDKLSLAAASEVSKISICSNTIPEIVNTEGDWMSGFSYLKWLFYNKGLTGLRPLSEIVVNREKTDMSMDCRSAMLKIKHAVYILNFNMVENYAAELLMFHAYNIVTTEEINRIIEEVEQSLEVLERICHCGKLSVSGQKVEILYSDVPVYNNMCLVESSNLNVAFLYAQYLNVVYTIHSDTFDLFNTWFDTWKRLSNQMSEGGIKNAIDFISKQKQSLALLRSRL